MGSRLNVRSLIAYGHDLLMTSVSFGLALYLRLGEDVGWYIDQYLLPGTLLLTATGAVVYWGTGLYRGVWRYASMRDLIAIFKAVTLVILIFVLLGFFHVRLEYLPRSVPVINWLILMAMLGGPRLAYRLIRDRQIFFADPTPAGKRIPVLLAGAADGAELFVRSLERSAARPYRAVGILSLKSNRVGQQIRGIPIVADMENLTQAVEQLSARGARPQRVILTEEHLDGAVVRNLFDQCSALGITLARAPSMTDLRKGDPNQMDSRPIDVADLLGRSQVPLDRDAMRDLLRGKRVLVTGAGGSIGSELVRQIASHEPAALALLDSSEHNLYSIDMEVGGAYPDTPRTAMIADVRSAERIEECFTSFAPEIVFHAAALKHVPLVEMNPCEGILTNVFGTVNVADACQRHRVQKMVQISTDKAVNPTNIMGATKRIAEQYCQALDIDGGNEAGPTLVTVRFGNVLGSTGSVIPLFEKQLAKGGPLTVTHPDMTRFFMTVREAVELVLMASAIADADPQNNGRIFVLDMGEPVRIMDLAEQMIRLSGYVPGKDIKIEITGCRPGEKLYEEVFHESESLVAADLPGMFLAQPRAIDLPELRHHLETLKNAAKSGRETEVAQLISALVPEAELESSAGQPN